ncbi:MAG TPA: histidine kinase [Pyrinomonadaceae bacterium]|jgi:sensor histidine kinase YesM
MNDETGNLRRPLKWGLLFGGWTLFAFFFTGQSCLQSAYVGRPVLLGRTLVVWLLCAYLWALLTPLVIWLARRFPIERGSLRSLLVHLLASICVSLLQLGSYVLLNHLLLADAARSFSVMQSFRGLFVAEFHTSLIIYWALVGLSHAYDYYRRYHERERRTAQLELEASQLETQLAQAQLDALRMQLHPHFLFNTLNTISVLMQEDVEAANRMLVRLSELLRLALRNTEAHEVSLKQELEFLRGYLEIEQTRFQDRLRVLWQVAPDTLDAQVPNLLLQPLVENAIRHGIAPRATADTAGTIEISAERHNGTIELRVRDDGAGLSLPQERNTSGIGLANTQARLQQLYGDAHHFRLAPAEGGGLIVSVTIPFHTVAGGQRGAVRC